MVFATIQTILMNILSTGVARYWSSATAFAPQSKHPNLPLLPERVNSHGESRIPGYRQLPSQVNNKHYNNNISIYYRL